MREMDDGRRYQGEISHQEVSRASSRWQNRKPPSGSWQPTVPSWEKKFCTSVGSIPWRKLLEMKKVMSYYENVVQWNDSAGEEAFKNAKSRFWAKINGLPCDITLPDPDKYIDEIDWNSEIDPELLLDLEREAVNPDEEERDDNAGLNGDSLFFLNRPTPCTGWGDAEDNPVREASNSISGPGIRESVGNVDNGVNPWEHGCDQGDKNAKNQAWGNRRNKKWNGSQWEKDNNEREPIESRRAGEFWGTWDRNCWKQEDAGQHMSRYRTSRFHGDGYGWRNGRGKRRANFVYDRPVMDKKQAPRNWNSMNSCGPISHHQSGGAGRQWSWDKPVL